MCEGRKPELAEIWGLGEEEHSGRPEVEVGQRTKGQNPRNRLDEIISYPVLPNINQLATRLLMLLGNTVIVPSQQ